MQGRIFRILGWLRQPTVEHDDDGTGRRLLGGNIPTVTRSACRTSPNDREGLLVGGDRRGGCVAYSPKAHRQGTSGLFSLVSHGAEYRGGSRARLSSARTLVKSPLSCFGEVRGHGSAGTGKIGGQRSGRFRKRTGISCSWPQPRNGQERGGETSPPRSTLLSVRVIRCNVDDPGYSETIGEHAIERRPRRRSQRLQDRRTLGQRRPTCLHIFD